ncbi:MAG: hypothetical protein LBU89_07205 [Fibromonadaceae bacterium]|jgi:hypothetical protein|nr:hypothetical protein [Fibromonadaceae bacterium]
MRKPNTIRIPNPLTLEWLAENAKKELLSSREMEIALSEYIFASKNLDMKLDKIFAENYPNTLKNAVKLAFGYYLDCETKEKKSHLQALLNLIKDMPRFSVFYKEYCSIKEEFDSRIMKAKKTWQKVKNVRFEESLMAVNILYLKIFLPNYNEIREQDEQTLDCQDYFLDAASDYLNKTKEHWKPLDKNLWKNESKLGSKMDDCFTSLLDDEELLEKIRNHIFAIMDIYIFRYTICEPFILDKSFKCDVKKRISNHDNADNILCKFKNQMLIDYFYMNNGDLIVSYIEHSKKKNPDSLPEAASACANSSFIFTPLLAGYFGIEDQFSYGNKTYDLLELIVEKGILDECFSYLELKELYDFYQEHSDDMSFEDILLETELPSIYSFSELARISQGHEDNFKMFGIDVGNSESRINLNLHNIFYCGKSDACFAFFNMKINSTTGYRALLNLLKKNKKRLSNEYIIQLLRAFPGFSDAKITVNNNKGLGIDIAIYKAKTLILIKLESAYLIENFAEKIKFEKCLIDAGHKLNEAIAALRIDAELLAEITGNNDKFEELKIETMIISDAFEFDGQKFQGHRKFSLLELMVILSGDVGCLASFSPKIIDQFRKNRKLNDLGELFLYDTDEPSVEDFFKALDSNIWEKVLPYWEE